MAQTKREIQQRLRQAGLAPLKQYGQHFLIDGNLMDKLVLAAELRETDTVLEVGPGTGALTERLLERAGAVVAVEIDRGLYELCANSLAKHSPHGKKLNLIHGDILDNKSMLNPRVLEALRTIRITLGGRIVLVANLPYQISTPLLIELLMGDLDINPMCCTLQAEVGDRLMAAAGNRVYGPISVYAQVMACLTRIARVGPESFWPPPEVNSVMLRIDKRYDVQLADPLRRQLRDLVRGCFNHRRKTLQSNLKTQLNVEQCMRVREAGRWNLNDRPERITPEQWLELASFLMQGHIR